MGQIQTGKRKAYIDYARGFMIFLIVLGHVMRKGAVMDYAGSTGVSGFFFLSGLVYHWKEDRKTYWLGRLRRLYVPYLAVGVISILVYRELGRFAAAAVGTKLKDSSLADNLLALLYANSKDHSMKWNETLWFVPCFLMVLLLVNLSERLIRRCRNGRAWRGIFVAVCLALNNLLTQRMDARLPWQLETAFAMAVFYEAGICFQKWTAGRGRKKPLGASGAFAGAIILILAQMLLTRWNGKISVRGDIYPHYLASFGIMVLGMAGWTLLAFAISLAAGDASHLITRILSRTGRSSFDIMLWNKFPVLVFQTILPAILPGFADLFLEQDNVRGVLVAIPIAAVCCVLCMIWTDLYRLPARLMRRRTAV